MMSMICSSNLIYYLIFHSIFQLNFILLLSFSDSSETKFQIKLKSSLDLLINFQFLQFLININYVFFYSIKRSFIFSIQIYVYTYLKELIFKIIIINADYFYKIYMLTQIISIYFLIYTLFRVYFYLL